MKSKPRKPLALWVVYDSDGVSVAWDTYSKTWAWKMAQAAEVKDGRCRWDAAHGGLRKAREADGWTCEKLVIVRGEVKQ